MINEHKILVTKPAAKRPLERHTHRWEDIIKVDIKEIRVWGCGLDSSGSG
jgi:hypothetical protein